MNPIAEEIRSYLTLEDGTTLTHYGVKYRSGRYPWGSGEDPYQNSCTFLSRYNELKKSGFTFTTDKGEKLKGDKAIAASLDISTTELRRELAIATGEKKTVELARIKSLRDDGLGYSEIARRMGYKSESVPRSMIERGIEAKISEAKNAAEFLKKQVDSRGMIDVGKGTNYSLNVSEDRMNVALHILQKEGYEVYAGGMSQPTNPNQQTPRKILCPPGTPYKDIYKLDQISSLDEYVSRDNGDTFERKFHYPESMDSKRLTVRYKEDGGELKDGVVEIRRGCKDLSLGESNYSQVRILVDGSHYIKGMAVYGDDKDFPPGVDLIFNTNKKKGTPALGPDGNTVLKLIDTKNPNNPFGSTIKPESEGGQSWYTDENGKKRLNLVNKRADEGDWSEWSDALPSQFLSKQSKALVKKQLDLAKQDKLAEYDDICKINNPAIKRYYLEKFASECDGAAVDLKGAALPGQKYHVIVPINSLKDNEIYAPQYAPGTKLALVRYPHGGTFEIPLLTVTHKNKDAENWIGPQSIDAVGITKKVADQLSGADFDGDTVMCIPSHDIYGKVKIAHKQPLKELEGFDPKMEYGPKSYEGRTVRLMTKKEEQKQMGMVTNLISDMTLLGATDDKIARAVKHSMVVIDARKHKLDYRKSAIDNDISSLQEEWQGHFDKDGKWHKSGAGTIVSRATNPIRVTRKVGQPKVNIKGKSYYDPDIPEGALIFRDDPKATYTKTVVNKRTGETKTITDTRKVESKRMAETHDAYDLVSDSRNPKELLYADYANSMKALANQARKEAYTTGKLIYSPQAKAKYSLEVASLNHKLNEALKNAPLEREAARRTNVEFARLEEEYKLTTGEKEMPKKEAGKLKDQLMNKYRTEVGSKTRKQRNIVITDEEWEAIQAGAISDSQLYNKILPNTDPDSLRQKATPRTTTALSTNEKNRIKALAASNYTLAEIAKKMGKSPSTISQVLKGGK